MSGKGNGHRPRVYTLGTLNGILSRHGLRILDPRFFEAGLYCSCDQCSGPKRHIAKGFRLAIDEKGHVLPYSRDCDPAPGHELLNGIAHAELVRLLCNTFAESVIGKKVRQQPAPARKSRPRLRPAPAVRLKTAMHAR